MRNNQDRKTLSSILALRFPLCRRECRWNQHELLAEAPRKNLIQYHSKDKSLTGVPSGNLISSSISSGFNLGKGCVPYPSSIKESPSDQISDETLIIFVRSFLTVLFIPILMISDNSFRWHVASRPDKWLNNTIDKLARDAEIAEFDVALSAAKNIWRFDISVDNIVLFLKDFKGLLKR